MNIKNLIGLCFAFFCVTAVAQDTTLFKNKIAIRDVYVSIGLFTKIDNYGTLQDFKKIVPQSTMINEITYDFRVGDGLSVTSQSWLAASMGINFLNKQKTNYKSNPQLRIGFDFSTLSLLSAYYYKTDRKRADTITVSNSSGTTTYYVDTVIHNSYHLSTDAKQLRLDASYICRSNPAARWSIFGGLGIAAGWSIRSNTIVSNIIHKDIIPDENSTAASAYSNDYVEFDFRHERNNTKGSYSTSVYIPLGIDFRIGKKSEGLKHFHLFMETRPSISLMNITEYGNVWIKGFSSSFGLRYNIK